jgi:hypothetical protein
VSVPDSGGLLANQRAMRDVGPGGRLPNDGNPFVALRRSRFALAGSCCSNALHEKTVQMVLQVLDFDVDIDVANRGPCILTPTLRSSGYVHRVLEGFDAALLDEVRSRGEAIEVVSPAQAAAGGFDALWVGIARVPEQGTLRGTGIGVLG